MSLTKYHTQFFPMGKKMDLGKEVDEEMEICVYYTLGGANYFNRSSTRRGVYVSFTPVVRSSTSITRMLIDDRGRKMLLQETRAKSDRVGRKMADIVAGRARPLADAAIAQDWDKVVILLTTANDHPEPPQPPAAAHTAPGGWDKVEGGAAA